MTGRNDSGCRSVFAPFVGSVCGLVCPLPWGLCVVFLFMSMLSPYVYGYAVTRIRIELYNPGRGIGV